MIKVEFILNGTRNSWYDNKHKIKSFKTEDDVFKYIDQYNVNAPINCYTGRIIDFKILN